MDCEGAASYLERNLGEATGPPGHEEPCIELDLDADLMQQLQRHYWSNHKFAASPGDVIDIMASYISEPWHVDLTWRLRGRSPELVAGALIDESNRRMNTQMGSLMRLGAP